MRLSEQCKMCKNNWDGHCVMGNDRWKARTADTEIECEEYEESEVLTWEDLLLTKPERL